MKHTNKLFLLIFGVIILFSACNKTDFDELAREQERQDSIEEARIKNLIKEQAPLLKAYVENPSNGWTNPILDTSRGIWYEILTRGQEDSYTYKRSGSGQIVAPKIEVKYKGQLLNGTVFDQTDEQSTNKKTFIFNLAQDIIPAWTIAFLPQKIPYNGQDYAVGGLTSTGLKKGSKIRFVAPSPWGYDTRERDKIPANSPLVFEIEVVDISDSQ
ncbi:FKBP-type peptidyl-prolyl cis-trans isomerase [Olivibacter domesticus]|uniref:Peptidyl-prolyl cis-trans isomerase n=1 Tax=Olivibacter domesticus TaxID=407022 RepID=A0A1H7SAE4_OLID1|nr:FKBP-type peptidyl-prolyl cis-trans isomerase [Olivibacter domesticus]SEL69591.1 FKBP-type peptidyl-prolyl cis-trans isomerase FkpA [Olivibacter domesticus]